jgi:hypothetical protein
MTKKPKRRRKTKSLRICTGFQQQYDSNTNRKFWSG